MRELVELGTGKKDSMTHRDKRATHRVMASYCGDPATELNRGSATQCGELQALVESRLAGDRWDITIEPIGTMAALQRFEDRREKIQAKDDRTRELRNRRKRRK